MHLLLPYMSAVCMMAHQIPASYSEVPGSSLGPGGWFIWLNALSRGTRKRHPLNTAWKEVHRVMMVHGRSKESRDMSLLLLWVATSYRANSSSTSITIPCFFPHLLLSLTIPLFCGIFLFSLLLYNKPVSHPGSHLWSYECYKLLIFWTSSA